MRAFASILGRWAPFILALLLIACARQGPVASTTPGQPQAAQLTALADVSLSPAAVGNADYADKAAELVGRDFSHFHLGDSARIVLVGDRSAEHAAGPPPIVTDYHKRLPVAERELVTELRSVFAKARSTAGDGSTNLLFTLENAHLTCTPGSRVVLISDMIESSDNYSAERALNAGKAVEIPPPSSAYLRGCTVAVYGLGMTSTPGAGAQQALSDRSLAALQAGWRAYFSAAGVRSADVTFTSIL